MSRFLNNDFLNKDPRALWTAEKAATISDIVTPTKQYLTVTSTDIITIESECVMSISGSGVFKTEATAIGPGNLDAGAFQAGKDYYIYICDPSGDNDEKYVISLNSTYPLGWNSSNSRKIGGFHYGVNRRTDERMRPLNTNDEAYGTGWEDSVYNGIVPRSVWTLHHRPKCNPEGMVYLGGGTWVDIYLSSDDGGGGVASRYDATPMTGTEGLNWYGFNERAAVVGKRLLTYSEFCRMAMGSPQGLNDSNDNAWTATTNTGRQVTGYVRNAVSCIGCRDAVGDIWEWLDELITNASGRVLSGTTNPASYTYGDRFEADGTTRPIVTNGTAHGPTTRGDNAAPAQGAWGWDRVSPFPGYGNIYEYYDQSLVALLAGGDWDAGVHAGARAVTLSNCPWHVLVGLGARCASDSL